MNRAPYIVVSTLFSFALLCGSAAAQPPPAPGCPTCGTVESVHHYNRHGETSGGGAILGGIAGGVVGHQFGHGHGNTAMTVLGAAGGAYAGNEIERRHAQKNSSRWQVRVRMDTGEVRKLSYRSEPPFREGERVRLMHGRLALLTR